MKGRIQEFFVTFLKATTRNFDEAILLILDAPVDKNGCAPNIKNIMVLLFCDRLTHNRSEEHTSELQSQSLIRVVRVI